MILIHTCDFNSELDQIKFRINFQSKSGIKFGWTLKILKIHATSYSDKIINITWNLIFLLKIEMIYPNSIQLFRKKNIGILSMNIFHVINLTLLRESNYGNSINWRQFKAYSIWGVYKCKKSVRKRHNYKRSNKYLRQ